MLKPPESGENAPIATSTRVPPEHHEDQSNPDTKINTSGIPTRTRIPPAADEPDADD